jgi:hypothetical protein
MKLKEIEHTSEYQFLIKFENGEVMSADLKDLICKYVNKNDLKTAHINQEWGCLEFNNGKVDIEPKTLYQYAKKQIH